jgi:FtsH-binding integral membrane protein
MSLSTAALVSASASSSQTSPVFYIVMAVSIFIVFGIMRAISARRDQRHMGAAGVATGDVAGIESALPEGPQPMAVLVAPAPPFDAVVLRLRDLLEEATPAPKITRYTRPIVMVYDHSLSITEKKGGVFLTIPAVDIVSVTSGPATIKPRGTILPRKFPAVHVTVRRGEAEETLALVPITGMYDKVTLRQADAIATEIGQRLQLRAS